MLQLETFAVDCIKTRIFEELKFWDLELISKNNTQMCLDIYSENIGAPCSGLEHNISAARLFLPGEIKPYSGKFPHHGPCPCGTYAI